MRVAIWLITGFVYALVLGVKLWIEFAGVVVHAGTWPEWITAVATAVLAGAALWALGELNEAKRDRHAQVFADLGRRWDDPPMAEALQAEARLTKEELAQVVATAHRGPSRFPEEDEASAEAEVRLILLLRVPNFFEDLMLITEEGGIDVKAVSRNFKGLALAEWDKWEMAIETLRQASDPYAFSQFENLVQKMRKLPDE